MWFTGTFSLSCLEFGCFRKILLGRVARVFLSGVLCIVLLNIVFYSLHPRIVTSLNMYSVHTILRPRRSGYHDLITCHQAWGLQIIKHRHQTIMKSGVYIASLNWWSSHHTALQRQWARRDVPVLHTVERLTRSITCTRWSPRNRIRVSVNTRVYSMGLICKTNYCKWQRCVQHVLVRHM